MAGVRDDTRTMAHTGRYACICRHRECAYIGTGGAHVLSPCFALLLYITLALTLAIFYLSLLIYLISSLLIPPYPISSLPFPSHPTLSHLLSSLPFPSHLTLSHLLSSLTVYIHALKLQDSPPCYKLLTY